ncbi:MAG: hypothetical protein OES38_18950 [Gammaproteobacteria bacterium]|nr:hypothetical protein [Gammaproteobacteria bacterium]
MNRVGAFLIHLGISLVIFAGLAYLLVYVWYPDFFFTSDGGWEGMRIIIGVDLVLGPALTLLVFRKGKRGLKLDLTMIGLFQAACLVAGTFVVYTERPLSMIYVDGQFFSMSSHAYADYGVDVPDMSSFPGQLPKWLSIELPEDLGEEVALRKQALQTQRPLRTLVDRYMPFSPDQLDLENDAFSIDELQDRDQETKQIPIWLAENGGALEDYAFFPFGTRYEYIFIGVDRRDGQVKGLLKTPAPL